MESEFNEIINIVPTFKPMSDVRSRFAVTSHSTYCDVMCTKNTYKVFDVRHLGNEAIAHMPFIKSKTLQTPLPLKSATLMQKLKVVENKNQRNQLLKQEREDYLFKLAEEERKRQEKLDRSATLIQSRYRGHMCRPMEKRLEPYKMQRKKYVYKCTLSEMHESLCDMAHQLRLKPIAGLNLESKAKTSRRKAKIEAAAVFRLVRYFRMLRAKFVAQREMKAIHYERVDRMARIITRFFRFIKMKKWNKNLQRENQTKAAFVLQNSYRCFAARKRVRNMREAVRQARREQEAAIKIQRSVSPMKLRRKKELDAQRTEKLSTRLSGEQVEVCVEYTVLEAVNIIAAEMAEEERRILEEACRVREVGDMETEDAYMGRFLSYCQELVEIVMTATETEYLENEVTITYHVAKTQVYEEREQEIRSRETSAFAEEEAYMRQYIRAKELRDNARLYAMCDKIVDDIKEKWIEFEIMRLYEAFLPDTIQRHVERQEEEARLAALQAQRARSEAIAGVVRIVTAQATRRAVEKLAAAEKQKEESQKIAAKSPKPTNAKIASSKPVPSIKQKQSPAKSEEPLQTIVPKSIVSEKPTKAPSMKESVPAVLPVISQTPGETAHSMAIEFVEVVFAKALSSPQQVQQTPISDKSVEPAEIIADDENAREEQDEEPVELPGEPVDEIDNNSQDAATISVVAEVNKRAADIEALIYGAEFGKAFAALDELRALVLANKGKSLSGSRHEYYLQLANLLAAECLVEIADYREAGLLLEMVVSSVEFMGKQSLEIVSDITQIVDENASISTLGDGMINPQLEIDAERKSRVWIALATIARNVAAYQTIEPYLERAIGLLNQAEYEGHLRVTVSLLLSQAYWEQGRYSDAALTIASVRENVGSVKDSEVLLASSMDDILFTEAMFLHLRGVFNEAEKLFEAVLEGRCEYFARNHPKIALTILQLGVIAMDKCEYSKATTLINTALDKLTDVYSIAGGADAKQWRAQAEDAIQSELAAGRQGSSNSPPPGSPNGSPSGNKDIKGRSNSPPRLSPRALRTAGENIAVTRINHYLALKHPAVATALYFKARCHAQLGNYTMAEKDMAAVLAGRRQIFDNSPHPAVAEAMMGLAEILRQMYVLAESLQLHEKALTIKRQCFKIDLHVDVAASIFAIGMTFLANGNYQQALVAFEHSLALRNELMSVLDVALLLDDEINKIWLAYCYSLLSRFDDAQAILGESGKRICSIVGNKHVRVAEGLCALGELMSMKGRYADAKKLLTRAAEMTSKLVGSEHPDVARINWALAENLRLPGDYAAASDICTESLNMRLHEFGNKNLCFALGLYNRAQILRDLDNLQEAEQLYSTALKIVKTSVGDESAHFALILGDVGECLRKMGNPDNARLVLTKAVSLRKKCCGEHSVPVYESIIYQALLEMDANDITNYQNALYVLNETVLPNLVPIIGNNHPLVHFVKANIGLCMNAIATLFLERGMVSRLEAMVGPDHPLMNRMDMDSENGSVGERSLDSTELPGQLYIDSAINALENYPQIPFSDIHPWLKRFGV